MLRQIAVIAVLLFTTSLALAGEAGRMVFIAGSVQVASQPAAIGHMVREGDEIVTGADGYAHLKTTDSGYLIVRPNSHARVVAYHIDWQNPANTRIKFELLRGVARSISGQAVPQARQNFRFNTPVAAIGVRGTDFTVFTDQQSSRVTVVSGGVIVSGFVGACGPAGAGPCEGGNSRELLADQVGQLLLVRHGQPVPQLLRSDGIAPDLTAPPRRNEPAAKAAGTSEAASTTGDGRPNAETNAHLINTALLIPVTPVTPLAPVAPVAPVAPAYGQVIWGRWQPLLGQAATIDFVKMAEAKAQLQAVNSYFAVMRSSGADWQTPSQGMMTFALRQSEAYILGGSASAPLPATLENGRLQVDFGAAAFATGFDLVSQQGERFSFKALGDVARDGRLLGASQFSGNANMVVNGAVGPENGGSAAYIFQGRIDDSRLAVGGASWVKN